MSYTNEDYAKMAIEANRLGKLLIINEKNGLEIVDIIKTETDIIEDNRVKKSALINDTEHQIAILKDAIDLGMQEDGDNERLKQWRKYRILLTRINPEQINIDWPEKFE